MKREARSDILVIGDHAAGRGVTENLKGKGLGVARAELPALYDLSGCFGTYAARLRSDERVQSVPVSGGIVVQEGRREAPFAALGLEPGDRVVSLSAFREVLPGLRPPDPAGRAPLAVFLLGLAGESTPGATRNSNP